MPKVQAKAVEAIELLLSHRFPRIRSMAAEQLYLQLSEDDVEPDLEELLLETSWTEPTNEDTAKQVTSLLRSTLCI